MNRPGLRATIVLLALLAPCAGAQPVLYDKSEIRFVSKQMGVDVEGRFRKWKATVDIRPDDLAQSRAELDIDLASIDLASEEAETELRRKDWFDTARFPVAQFKSSAIKASGSDRYDVAGRLTLKGATRDMVIPVQVRKDAAGNTIAEGQFVLKRFAFNIGDGPWSDPSVVADDVLVRVRIVLARAG
jgi:polyisoprenoid-binding protein YceI